MGECSVCWHIFGICNLERVKEKKEKTEKKKKKSKKGRKENGTWISKERIPTVYICPVRFLSIVLGIQATAKVKTQQKRRLTIPWAPAVPVQSETRLYLYMKRNTACAWSIAQNHSSDADNPSANTTHC